MDKQRVAEELVKVARDLAGTNYPEGYTPSDRELKEFYNYVLKFYGSKGLYPLAKNSKPVSVFEINDATKKLLKGRHVWGGGDSVDREAVRDILIDEMGYNTMSVGKEYYLQYNVGKAKYVVNFHDGEKTHGDGSPFYDISTFSNKKYFQKFIKQLQKDGYKEKR